MRSIGAVHFKRIRVSSDRDQVASTCAHEGCEYLSIDVTKALAYLKAESHNATHEPIDVALTQ